MEFELRNVVDDDDDEEEVVNAFVVEHSAALKK